MAMNRRSRREPRRFMADSSEREEQQQQTFPFKLYDMLEYAHDSEFASTLSWLPNGNAFFIHNSDALMNDLAPKFFHQTKFRSFTRQLNIWGFVRTDPFDEEGKVRSKRNWGGWQHRYFLRGRADLLKEIVRTEIKSAVKVKEKSKVKVKTNTKKKKSSFTSRNIQPSSSSLSSYGSINKNSKATEAKRKSERVKTEEEAGGNSSSLPSGADSPQASQLSFAYEDNNSIQLHKQNVNGTNTMNKTSPASECTRSTRASTSRAATSRVSYSHSNASQSSVFGYFSTSHHHHDCQDQSKLLSNANTNELVNAKDTVSSSFSSYASSSVQRYTKDNETAQSEAQAQAGRRSQAQQHEEEEKETDDMCRNTGTGTSNGSGNQNNTSTSNNSDRMLQAQVQPFNDDDFLMYLDSVFEKDEIGCSSKDDDLQSILSLDKEVTPCL